jgi:REP element-mobilizing transposase RayT
MERYRIRPEAAVYYFTYSVVEWLPVFMTAATFGIVTQSLTCCHQQKHLRINAFVVMPTHLHMIVFDASFGNERLIRALTDCRKFTGR